MKLAFTAHYNINGTQKTEAMTYDTVDVIKTLERRLKTAFPNATGISITLDNEQQGEIFSGQNAARQIEAHRATASAINAAPRGAK